MNIFKTQRAKTKLRTLPKGREILIHPMRVLIKVADGDYYVEVVNSVDEAFAACRRHGAQSWNQIGWQQPI